MLRAGDEQWRACAGCLAGHPAFILGNGPTLPEDLSVLDEFFTVGVNRIPYRYDPTVLMWLDAPVTTDIEPYLGASRAIKFARDEFCRGRWNELHLSGLLKTPDSFVDFKNSGVSAAYWVMALGCRPVYLLGMSATYDGRRCRTNFYGKNRRHVPTTLGRLRRALDGLLAHPDVHAIAGQDVLSRVAKILVPFARGRHWYVERFACIHSRQQPVSARR